MSQPFNINLHYKQGLALQTEANEVLYGGAAAGGKSYLMRIAAVVWAMKIPGLQVYLFRRLLPDLIKTHVEGPKGLRALLAEYVNAGLVTIVETEIRFWNGSKIFLCHCKDEQNRFNYVGMECHVLLIDEITHFTEVIYRFLRSRVRAVGLSLAEEDKGKFPRILVSGNPGGIGHQWVKATWVDPSPPGQMWRTKPEDGGMLRQFIQAKLQDNPSMTEEDPLYAHRLSGLGSPELVKCMLDGDWNVVAGAFFPQFGNKHIIRPFEIPDWWTRFKSMDWGSTKPFCVQWHAVADGSMMDIPKNAIVTYREWYGAASPDVGLRMAVEDVADGIKERELGERVALNVADPSIFKNDGGPSIAETFGRRGVYWRRADNSRMAGLQQIHSRLRGDGLDPRPLWFVFDTCRDIIRTLPVMQHDANKPEDMDTTIEDHAVDALRYGLMSRPIGKFKPTKKQQMRGLESMTLNELWDREKEERGRRGMRF